MLFLITIASVLRKKSEGKLSGSLSLLNIKKFSIAVSPASVLMFVYMDLASAVKILAISGSWMFLSSLMKVVESYR